MNLKKKNLSIITPTTKVYLGKTSIRGYNVCMVLKWLTITTKFLYNY